MKLSKPVVVFLILFWGSLGAEALAQNTAVNTELEFAQGEYSFVKKEYVAAESHFRKLVARRPENARAHFWLGATLYAQGKTEAARAEFQKVVELKEPADFVEKSKAYLAGMEGKGEAPKWWVVNLATGLRYDSNLYLEANGINVLSDEDDFAWDVYIRGAVFPVRQERFLFGLEYSFFNSLYFENGGFSFNTHRAGAILGTQADFFSMQFRPNFQATFVEYGGDRYETLAQFPVAFRFAEGDIGTTELNYRFELEEFSNVGTEDFVITTSFLRDNTAHFPGIDQYFYFAEKKGFVSFGVMGAFENARNPYDIRGVDFHGRFGVPLPAQFYAEIFGGYFIKSYYNDDLPDIAFVPNNIERFDRVATAGATLKKVLTGPLWTSVGYQYLDNDSNEIAFDYDKHLATLYFGVDL